MTAKQTYEIETGDKCPDNQIGYHEWHIRYVQWLEERFEIHNKTMTLIINQMMNKNK